MFDSTNEEYHTDADAISSSALKALARSAARFKGYLDGIESHSTRSRILGTAVHAAVLEPARFEQEYVIWPGRRAGRAWETFLSTTQTKHVLTQAEYDLVYACADKALRTKTIINDQGDAFTLSDLISFGMCERNIYWIDAETGLTCRARYDLICQHLTVDLKTTDDARQQSFAWQCARLGYDIQAAFYLRGRRAFAMCGAHKALPFVLLAAELNKCPDAQAHLLHPEQFIAFGDRVVSDCMRRAKLCFETGEFPGYEPPATLLQLPIRARYPDHTLGV